MLTTTTPPRSSIGATLGTSELHRRRAGSLRFGLPLGSPSYPCVHASIAFSHALPSQPSSLSCRLDHRNATVGWAYSKDDITIEPRFNLGTESLSAGVTYRMDSENRVRAIYDMGSNEVNSCDKVLTVRAAIPVLQWQRM